MVEKLLIGSGLALIPFFSLAGYDTRSPKLCLALCFALALGLWVVYNGRIKQVANKWIYLLIGYLLLRCFIKPQFLIVLGTNSADSLWQWKPMAEIIIFFLFFISVASLKFWKAEKEYAFKIISWVGAALSSYAIVQSLNIDQFFKASPLPHDAFPEASRICATLGQPTILAAFLAIILPISLSTRKWAHIALISAALLLTKSHVGIFAAGIAVLTVIGLKTKLRTVISLSLACFIIAGAGMAIKKTGGIPDSGRFPQWKQVVKEANKFPITGFGLGSFKYVYPQKHKVVGNSGPFKEAHNDFLQFGYEAGLAGLALLLLAIWNIFRRSRDRFISGALLASCLCAFGSFPWQLGAHIYYTVFLAGLVYAREDKIGNASTDM